MIACMKYRTFSLFAMESIRERVTTFQESYEATADKGRGLSEMMVPGTIMHVDRYVRKRNNNEKQRIIMTMSQAVFIFEMLSYIFVLYCWT